LAARGLGTFVLFLTLYATAYSGNTLLGYPGQAYRQGFSWVVSTGFMLSIVVVFHALAPRLRPIAIRGAFVTPGDWIRFRFAEHAHGRVLLLAVSLLMTVALANYLFAQLKAMGELAEQVTAGAIPYAWGVVLLAGVILLYETLGGMRAVAWTDAVQGIMMLFGLAALLEWILSDTGGLEVLTLEILRVRPGAAAVPGAHEQLNWFSTIALMGLASVIYPQAIQRIYAARSARVLRRSLALMALMPLVTTLVVTLIGLAAIARYPGLGDIEADRVMPLLLADWADQGGWPSLGALVVFLGALAAIMSTADSVLLSLGSVVAEDLFGRSHRDARTTRFGKRIAVVVMVAMTWLAISARGVTLWGVIELKMELLIQCVPAFLIAIHWPRLRAGPACIGLAVGVATAIAGVVLQSNRLFGIHVGVIGVAINAAIACIGSLIPRSSTPSGQLESTRRAVKS
ncbi:MAG TPA: sodium:solute symporter family protein, partial [Myxococcota bacterium]|nr:sodium:solute symporter family protein [Myxococcota bacterium]